MATITRTADSGEQAGAASRIALVTGVPSGHVTTGVRTAEGHLRLIEWAVTEDSVLRGNEGRLARDTAEVALTTRAGAFLTTALRTNGDLRVVTWDSGLQPVGDSGDQAGAATQVTVCRLDVIGEPPDQLGGLVTAVRDSEGDLKVIEWRVSEEGRLVRRVADSGQQAGEAKEVSIAGGARGDGTNVVVTAVKTNEDRLKLIAWGVPGTSGGSVVRRGDSGSQAGGIGEVAAVGAGRVVTAVRTNDGTLRLIVWQVAPDGSEIVRLGDSGNQAGRASRIALAPFGRDRYLTAVRTAEGNLRLIAWEVSSDGRSVTRAGDSGNQAGQVGEVTLADRGNGLFVTAVRDSNERLRVIAWKVEE